MHMGMLVAFKRDTILENQDCMSINIEMHVHVRPRHQIRL